MALSHLLQDFGDSLSVGNQISISDVSLEEQRLESFEQGFKAGWDDAIKSQGGEQAKISSEFSRNMQDLSFTYHEAHTNLFKAMEPLLQQMVETVLPKIAHQTIGARVVEQLSEMARDQGDQPVQITVAPSNHATMEKLLQQEFGFPLSVVEEPTLGEGQVYLKFGQSERQIDLDEVLNGIGQAVAAFFHENQKEIVNG